MSGRGGAGGGKGLHAKGAEDAERKEGHRLKRIAEDAPGISWSPQRPIFAALRFAKPRLRLRLRYQLVALATYLADSVALILRLGHETRCLYAALPVEAAAADASF